MALQRACNPSDPGIRMCTVCSWAGSIPESWNAPSALPSIERVTFDNTLLCGDMPEYLASKVDAGSSYPDGPCPSTAAEKHRNVAAIAGECCFFSRCCPMSVLSPWSSPTGFTAEFHSANTSQCLIVGLHHIHGILEQSVSLASLRQPH